MTHRTDATQSILPLKPGLYFNLPEELYFTDSALSRTSIKQLLESPHEYWLDSPMNPAWKPPHLRNDTNADKKRKREMEDGKAFHTLLLEPHLFPEQFKVIPGDPLTPDGRPIIERARFMEMKQQVDIVKEMEIPKQLLQDGYPEVTLVWRDEITGAMFKTRHDYFREFCSVDYKTIYRLNDGAVKAHMRTYAYDLQAALYFEARVVLKKLLKEKKAGVWGCNDSAFIKRFMDDPDDMFAFIFQKTEAPYTARMIHLDDDSMEKSALEVLKAKHIYNYNMEKYGTRMKWPVSEGQLEEFSLSYGSTNSSYQRRFN